MYIPATLTETGWNGVGVHFTFPVHSLSAYRTAKVTRNKISLASGLEYNFITSESVRIFATDRSLEVLGSDEHQMPQQASLQRWAGIWAETISSPGREVSLVDPA